MRGDYFVLSGCMCLTDRRTDRQISTARVRSNGVRCALKAIPSDLYIAPRRSATSFCVRTWQITVSTTSSLGGGISLQTEKNHSVSAYVITLNCTGALFPKICKLSADPIPLPGPDNSTENEDHFVVSWRSCSARTVMTAIVAESLTRIGRRQ